MITQQELIDRLNQLTLHYNLSWGDIKYDADKAIAKINAYLGTKYPKMSSIMLAAHNGYTLNSSGTQVEIFPDEYIHSIVIPYIAMEVLARDEEFTTIYNKYTAELEEGLFTMFQKEFNRVPLVFRQDNDQGVFFETATAQAAVARNLQDNLPTFKFRVYYHINNDEIVLSAQTSLSFLEDNHAYEYEEEAEIQGWNKKLLSFNGANAYEFVGWTLDSQQTAADGDYAKGSKISMTSDLHLYAKWNTVSTMHITSAGVVSLKSEYANNITYLEIPTYINNILAREVQSYFCTKNTVGATITASNLATIVLPKYLVKLQTHAFDGFQGAAIVFQETPVSTTYGGITIEASAFALTPHLTSIILPANVRSIYSGAFPAVNNKEMTIMCRTLYANKPAWDEVSNPNTGWNYPACFATTSGTYTLNLLWGYNG